MEVEPSLSRPPVYLLERLGSPEQSEWCLLSPRRQSSTPLVPEQALGSPRDKILSAPRTQREWQQGWGSCSPRGSSIPPFVDTRTRLRRVGSWRHRERYRGGVFFAQLFYKYTVVVIVGVRVLVPPS